MSFASSGLPVLTSSTVEYWREGRSIKATATIHMLAINFHFTRLKPPPANKTIGAAQLSQLESKRLRKKPRAR